MILLDTHVFIWCRTNSPRLPSAIRNAVASPGIVYVSHISAWEIALKQSLGRLEIDESFEDGIARGGFRPLPVSLAQIARLPTLPHHHRDPFDRMLVCQALEERLTIATVDRHLGLYDVPILGV
jgi:PIN domain nuclease of toxin-antitoxin system